MSEIEVTAKLTEGGEATIMKDFGDDCEDAIKKFGEQVVFTNFRSAAKITCQGAMRRYLKAGKKPEEVAKMMEAWKPGVALERAAVSKESFKDRFQKMSREEQIAILQELKDDIKSDSDTTAEAKAAG